MEGRPVHRCADVREFDRRSESPLRSTHGGEEDETSGWDQKGEVKPGFERSRFLASVLPEGRLVACRVGLPIRVRPQSGKGSHLMQSYHRMCLSFPAENPR